MNELRTIANGIAALAALTISVGALAGVAVAIAYRVFKALAGGEP